MDTLEGLLLPPVLLGVGLLLGTSVAFLVSFPFWDPFCPFPPFWLFQAFLLGPFPFPFGGGFDPPFAASAPSPINVAFSLKTTFLPVVASLVGWGGVTGTGFQLAPPPDPYLSCFLPFATMSRSLLCLSSICAAFFRSGSVVRDAA